MFTMSNKSPTQLLSIGRRPDNPLKPIQSAKIKKMRSVEITVTAVDHIPSSIPQENSEYTAKKQAEIAILPLIDKAPSKKSTQKRRKNKKQKENKVVTNEQSKKSKCLEMSIQQNHQPKPILPPNSEINLDHKPIKKYQAKQSIEKSIVVYQVSLKFQPVPSIT